MLGMAFEPEFSVTARLLQTVEAIAALRERIAAAMVQVAHSGAEALPEVAQLPKGDVVAVANNDVASSTSIFSTCPARTSSRVRAVPATLLTMG